MASEMHSSTRKVAMAKFAKNFTLDDFRRQLDVFQKWDGEDWIGRIPVWCAPGAGPVA